MSKKKNATYLLITFGIIAVIVLALIFRRPKMILFYSDTCPHCQNVEEYINEKQVRQKLEFRELEVAQNQTNARLLANKAFACGLDTAQGVGIPLFFDGQTCYQGDTDIIDYFKGLE